MQDTLGSSQPAAPAAPAPAQQAAPQNAAQPPQQFGLQNYNCIQHIDHFASTEYVNICNGNRFTVQDSPFTITLGVIPILIFLIGLAVALKTWNNVRKENRRLKDF